MYEYIAEKIIYPLGDLLIGTSLMHYFHFLQETQWWNIEQQRDLQNKKLQRLIEHAYENVPYYRKLFDDRSLTVHDIQTVDDLAKLPILTKKDIRQNFDSIIATNYQNLKPILSSTSGSTGEPLKYYITKDLASISWAGMFRAWSWVDHKLGDKRINLGGSNMNPPKPLDIMKKARLFIERTSPISTLNIDDNKLRQIANKFLQYKPKYVYGYASSIYLVADFLIKQGMDNIHLRAAFTTSEMLLPHYRTKIEKAFHCEVIDCYGSYDGGSQAIECPCHKGYHISSEKSVIELLDEKNQAVQLGQAGEIITTDLHNYAMPFIRYAVGDMGIISNKVCSCGRGLPLLQSIEGRSLDFILLPNGSKIRGLDLIDVFYEHLGGDSLKELASIKGFQIVQNKRDQIRVHLSQDIPGTIEEIDYIKTELIKALGYPMDIHIEFVDQITELPNGKRKFIICNLQDINNAPH